MITLRPALSPMTGSKQAAKGVPMLRGKALAIVGCAAGLTGCGTRVSPTSPSTQAVAATVVSISPANAMTGVDPTRPVVITFTRSMMNGMEALVVLHEGAVSGAAVGGTFAWSADRTMLTFTPAAPLKRGTMYTLHLAPSLVSADGKSIDLAACTRIGGQYATTTMMGAGAQQGMMTGAWGPGMMGSGWRAADGTYGMVFSFTTA